MIFAFDIRQAPAEQLVFLFLLAAVSGVCLARLRHRKPKTQVPIDPLDTPLFQWEPGEFFTERDMLNGGVAIFGRSGSGKTSGSGRCFAESIVRHPRSGGLILGSKPEDPEMWRGIFAKYGRRDDLIVFNADGELRFNLLDYVCKMGADTRECTKCLMTISETLRSNDSKGREDADFWEQEQFRMLFCAIELVKAGAGRVTAPDIQRFIATAATNPEYMASDVWKADFHNQAIKAGYEKERHGVAKHDFDLAMSYWLREFPSMADRTRSSIQTGVMGMLHTFNTGVVRQSLSTTTNVSPDDMLEGHWILVNWPPSHYGDSGNFVNAGWKYLTQKAVLRRHAKPDDAINCIWMDEAQNFLNSFDSHYLAECRSHRGCVVALTQSLHSVFSKLKGDTGYHQSMALLSNFNHKVFHALGSAQDADFASKLIGNSLQTFVGGSMPPQQDLFDALLGKSQFSGSFSEKFERTLQPDVFMNGLKTGGPENGYLAEAIVVKSGKPFRTGQNWRRVAFAQR